MGAYVIVESSGGAGRVEEIVESDEVTLVAVRYDNGHLGHVVPEGVRVDTRYAQPGDG